MIKIVGAGISGLLAAATIRSQTDHYVHVYDPKLFHNKTPPLFRFRRKIDKVSLKRVNVYKHVESHSNPIADALNYSFKVCGKYNLDRSIMDMMSPVQRFIPDGSIFEELMHYITSLGKAEFHETHCNLWNNEEYNAVIVTAPLRYTIQKLYGTAFHPLFKHCDPRDSFSYTFVVPGMDAHLSIYVPHPYTPVSRVSVTGSRVCVEANAQLATLDTARHMFPIPAMNAAVITDCDFAKHLGSKFVDAPSETMNTVFDGLWVDHKVLCLGRLARMESGFLAEHTIDLIHDWISKGYI